MSIKRNLDRSSDPFDTESTVAENLRHETTTPNPSQTRPVFRFLALVLGGLILATGVAQLFMGPINFRVLLTAIAQASLGILFFYAAMTGEWMSGTNDRAS